jgi:hypothetical protein
MLLVCLWRLLVSFCENKAVYIYIYDSAARSSMQTLICTAVAAAWVRFDLQLKGASLPLYQDITATHVLCKVMFKNMRFVIGTSTTTSVDFTVR